MAEPSSIRVGVIGLGSISTYMHLPALRSDPRANVVAGADINEYQADRIRRQFRLPRVYSDWREVLDERPDAVVISLPTWLHQEVTGAALDAGCHVLCEKPFGTDPKGAAALARKAGDAGKVLMVGYHNRFLPSFRRARTLVRQGAIGKLLQIRGTHVVGGPYLSWEPKSSWYFSERGGGVLFDGGSHLFDTIRFLTGTSVAEAHAITQRLNADAEAPDEVAISWRTEEGVIGTGQLGWGGKTSRQEVFLYGDSGHLTVTPMEVEIRSARHNKITDMFSHLDSAWRIGTSIAKTKLAKDGAPPAYQAQMKAFLDRVHGTRVEEVSIDDSVGTLHDLGRVVRSESTLPTASAGRRPPAD